jgi:predicted dehydrogenase
VGLRQQTGLAESLILAAMAPKRLSVGLIGVGGFGASHLKALSQLKAEGLVRLVCVADPATERLADTQRKLESGGVRWYTDYQSLLEQESDLDAVAIAAPIHLHLEIAAAAIARGLFVYLEKPPVPLIQQLTELIALDVHGRVAVGFQLINSSPMQQLKLWRMQGALGELQSIRVHGCSPRSADYYMRTPWAGKMMFEGKPVFDGPATNALSHWLHNIMYLAAQRRDEFDLPSVIEGELYRARAIESYDTICLRGRLESGVDFHFAVTHATEKSLPCRLELVGSRGRAWVTENETVAANNLGLPPTVAPCSDSFQESWRQFVRFAQGEEARAATHLEDTRGYVLATNAALMSSGAIHNMCWQKVQSRPDCADDGKREEVEVADFVERSAREGRLFSELNMPLAKKGIPAQIRHIDFLKLVDYC